MQRLTLLLLAFALAGCPARGGRGGSSDSNDPPSAPEIAVTPTDPGDADDLTLAITVESEDPEDEDVTYVIEWTRDGELVEELEDPYLVPADLTLPDQVWEVTVWGYDGDDRSDPAVASVTVTNSAPSAPVISLTPATPGDFDDLVLSITTESVDPDGDEVTYVIEWDVDGSPVTDLADPYLVPQARTSLNETWQVTVTATDGLADSEPDSASVTVSNAPPVVSGVTLGNGDVYTEDVITVSATATDSEGDAVTLSYQWFVDGAAVGETGPSLDGSTYFDKNQEVYVIVTPSDAFGTGNPGQSNTITVLNTSPTTPIVSISPSQPVEGEDDLVCELSFSAFDIDGDTLTYTFAWDFNGTPFPTSSASTTSLPGDTVGSNFTLEDDTWTCVVTANDGQTNGGSASDAVLIQGPAPDLIVDGSVVNLSGGVYTYDDVMVINGGLLLIDGVVQIVANDFVVDAFSTIRGTGAGGAGGIGATVGSGSGGGGVSTNAGSGGGGYGGAGGDGGFDSGDTPGSGGSAYGSATSQTVVMGSGGGGATDDNGGDGGAALWLLASNIDMAGLIEMAGADGGSSASCGSSGRCAGGGSGGGILLHGDVVSITGTFDVSGGDGNPGNATFNDSGGGGGGGRVKVFYDASLFDNATFILNGGTGGPNGGFDGGDNGSTGTAITDFAPF